MGGTAVCYHCERGEEKQPAPGKLGRTMMLEGLIKHAMVHGDSAVRAIEELTSLVGKDIAEQVVREIQDEVIAEALPSPTEVAIKARWPEAVQVD